MRLPILKKIIKFENARSFYTARQVYDLIKDELPPSVNIYTIGRYLASHSKEKGTSREGVVYLCEVELAKSEESSITQGDGEKQPDTSKR